MLVECSLDARKLLSRKPADVRKSLPANSHADVPEFCRPALLQNPVASQVGIAGGGSTGVSGGGMDYGHVYKI